MPAIVPNTTIPATTVLSWYGRHARPLPWREPDVTAWQILISEIMLQQTPVARVEPVWRQWIRRWPVPSALAAQTPGDVVRAWGKLGYPRRALRLHECATVLARDFDDTVPTDVSTLLTLPGVGDYTARAVACFAYGQRVPVVDINVRRVVARAVHGKAQEGSPSKSDLAEVEALLPANQQRAATFSAGLMELGALVCTARNPDCAACPLTECRWVQSGCPAHTGPAKRVQKFAGTDRQVRGLLLDVLRDNATPMPRTALDVVWHHAPQRDRALDSLLVDGLVELTADGRYALAGEA